MVTSALEELISLLEQIRDGLDENLSPEAIAKTLGLSKGISGYMYHTVPVVLYVWLKNQLNYNQAIETIIRLGGDADTTAAIIGGIVGAGVGVESIKSSWLENIVERPFIFIHNMLFLLFVLLHGFRRLLPPY